jgi:hypothetical protein
MPSSSLDELRLLPSDDLFNIARNVAAERRVDAIRILVERGSPYCGHQDISTAAAALVHGDPSILKTTDPSVHVVGRLPGVLDIIARTVERTGVLENKVSDLQRVLAKLQDTEERLLTGIKQASRRLIDHQARLATLELAVAENQRHSLTPA